MSIHDGHRKRMRKRFLEHGFENFDEHTALEMLLFYTSARNDVNPLAHRLLNRFGSMSAVMDAPIDELMKIDGVGETTAVLLKLIPQISQRYMIAKGNFDSILNSTQKAGEYMIPRFVAERDEVVYLVCLDAKCKVINCRQLFRGSVNSANISIRKIVENALAHNATNVLIAHNHTSGVAIPSKEDIAVTKKVVLALKAVDIKLVDHIIVADGDFVSMADSGLLD